MYLFTCSFSSCSLLSIVVLFFNWHVVHHFFACLLRLSLELGEAAQTCLLHRNAFNCVKADWSRSVASMHGKTRKRQIETDRGWRVCFYFGEDDDDGGLPCFASAELKREIWDLQRWWGNHYFQGRYLRHQQPPAVRHAYFYITCHTASSHPPPVPPCHCHSLTPPSQISPSHNTSLDIFDMLVWTAVQWS